ncbi:hypothetical protein ENSA7_62400 [Enhygromyxa salina]|uniref:Uncharacterized protein n=1 Tax=Enhygromyxa salina TaxID=215803 RepID=A0A2S9Y3D3_9BACT|nr:hypothetical protein ENSA7_62400 [Enhygromyxa salina]
MVTALWLAAPLGCGAEDDAVPGSTPGQVQTQIDAAIESDGASGEPAADADPVEPVPDCAALHQRAARSGADVGLLPVLCPGIRLDHSQLRRVLLEVGSAAEAATMVAALDRDAELQGLVRLAMLDHASQPLPAELLDPATALLTPIDDRILASVELAHALLREPELDELRRTQAHALLARIYLQALASLGLRAGRPLPPFARLLAGPALFHGRSFCRFYWQRRVAGLERTFADTELELLALLIDLENTPHAGDPALLAVERQRTRAYLESSGPTGRIAARARQRSDAPVLGTDLLLPFVHELDRLFDHGFIDLALDRAMQRGSATGGYGLDPLAAVVTEDLRERDLREYERRLARRVERARRTTPSSRHVASSHALEPELPVEWPNPARVAEEAHAWLKVAHGRGPDFARSHARARVVRTLRWRPDAIHELLDANDDVVRAHHDLLFALLDAVDDGALARLRPRVAGQWPPGSSQTSRDTRTRQRFALATRDALLHPR